MNQQEQHKEQSIEKGQIMGKHTCKDTSFPSEVDTCFFKVSTVPTRDSISVFFAAKASVIFVSALAASAFTADKFCCSCFMRASYELLSSLCLQY